MPSSCGPGYPLQSFPVKGRTGKGFPLLSLTEAGENKDIFAKEKTSCISELADKLPFWAVFAGLNISFRVM